MLAVGICIGLALGLWLYRPIFRTYLKLSFDPLPYGRINPLHEKTNPASLIRLPDLNAVARKRNALVRFIWRTGDSLESARVTRVEKGFVDPFYSDIPSLDRIDKLIVGMEHGFEATVYFFHSQKSKKQLAIYHAGHEGSFGTGKKSIATLIESGFDVLALTIPVGGENNSPKVNVGGFGVIHFSSHKQFPLLETKSFSPLKLFFHPVAASINYAQKEYGYKSAVMLGLSGGGWVTTVYAAIDPRIRRSYPVAGSLPLYLRSHVPRDWGDYEQNHVGLLRIANYLELYVLGALGGERRQLQVLNKFDSCCLPGVSYQLYEDVVRSAVTRLGPGRFDVYSDSSHYGHKISARALAAILADISG